MVQWESKEGRGKLLVFKPKDRFWTLAWRTSLWPWTIFRPLYSHLTSFFPLPLIIHCLKIKLENVNLFDRICLTNVNLFDTKRTTSKFHFSFPNANQDTWWIKLMINYMPSVSSIFPFPLLFLIFWYTSFHQKVWKSNCTTTEFFFCYTAKLMHWKWKVGDYTLHWW